MTDEIHLYSYRRCPFAIRVRMTLHEKGLPFTTHEEDLRNFSETIRTQHPEAKIPLLKHGDTFIYESAIITEYLEEQYPDVPLMPTDTVERATVRLWTYWMNHHMKPDVDRIKYGASRFHENELTPAAERMPQHLQKLESRLTDHDWLVGDRLSLADIHCFPFVRQLDRMIPRLELIDAYPATRQWLHTILARPSFILTMQKNES